MTNSFLSKATSKRKTNKPANSFRLFKSTNFQQSTGSDAFLGNIGKSAELPQNSAKNADFIVSAYQWLKALRGARWRGVLNLKHEVFSCRTRPIPGIDKKTGKPHKISIDFYPGGENGQSRHAYRGVKRCASAMVCPVCGASLRWLRGQEIREIGQKMLGAGYTFVFVTFTARHGVDTDFRKFVKNFQQAQRVMKTYKGWRELKEQGLFTMRTAEVTDDNPDFKGARSGFHFHNHTVLWLDRPPLTEEEAEKLGVRLSDMWRRALDKFGMEAVDGVGVTVELPQTKKGVVNDTEALDKLSEYLMKGAALEMTGAIMKSGRADGRRVPIWTILRLAAERDDVSLWKRWQEYMEGIVGVSFLQFSQGLREFCGLGKELTDEELLDGVKGEPVRVLEYDEFKAVVRQGGQGKLLLLADKEGLSGIERGIKAALAGCDILTGEILDSS